MIYQPITIDFDGDELKVRRVAAGMGRLKFAKRLRTSHSRVWKWEAGKCRPSPPYMSQICNVLGCQPEDLCRPADTATPPEKGRNREASQEAGSTASRPHRTTPLDQAGSSPTR